MTIFQTVMSNGRNIPTISYISEADLGGQAGSHNLGSLSTGSEYSIRNHLMFTAGNWLPSGTVNQTFNIGGVNSIYNKSYRLATGTYIDSTFASYNNRDYVIFGPNVPIGTTSSVTLTNSVDGASYNGRYWWYVLNNLALNTGPIYTTFVTGTIISNISIPADGILTFMTAGGSGLTANIGTSYGTQAATVDYWWKTFVYQNNSGVTEVQNLIVPGATLIFAYVWR